MPRKTLTSRTLENVFQLYKKEFNLGNEYQVQKANTAINNSNIFRIIKIVKHGGYETPVYYTKPMELINRLTESMILGNPLF